MSTSRIMVRLRRGLDLRYFTAGNLAMRAWPLARIAAAVEVSHTEARTMIDDAVAETGARVRWCGGRDCDAYVVGAPVRGAAAGAALDAARDAGWRFDGRGVMRCRGCA